ncbi:hypothetical protein GH714_037571 [Hevea brasiliensis]|uniref:RNA helicase n=1 Tax=Hevea brasiliensis TaxID=3981 RepID=A0A6A6MRU0_HEVBR|nr:hypothetical protein GH714_037571 [Hevea brasiliensis]
MEPIICTQPRRFAVVAVAKMVAQARNCELGGEVGYHMGHSKLFSVRVVLMSATADFGRYRDYFKDLGRGERVEITEFLGISSESLATRYCSGPNPSMAAAEIKPEVILATNIAESSVTIPKVAYVIDSCRSLQVFWDFTRKMDSAELIWVSKSQADQRKGRTGRTCDGQIYRLVTGSFFNKLQEHESPAILRLSLRQQVLMIFCAESKAINDPRALLQKVLDPPHPQVVEEALNLLVRINALRTSTRGRYEPSFYGRLLASFSLSFDASVLILKFGDIGLLREGILMVYRVHICYFGGDCNNIVKLGRKEMVLIGNLCAYQFWQRVFKDKHRLEHLKRLSRFDEMKTVTSLLLKIEEEWCSFHNLVQSSLHQVSEIYEDVLNSLHRFRPRFLAKCDGLPTYYDPYEFGHVCLLKSQRNGDRVVAADDEHEPSNETKKCCAVPFIASGHFQTINVAEKLSIIVKEMRVQLTENASDNHASYVDGDASGGCRNGEPCFFSHDSGSSTLSFSLTPSLPEEDDFNAASLLQFLPASLDGCILLLDDTDFISPQILLATMIPPK